MALLKSVIARKKGASSKASESVWRSSPWKEKKEQAERQVSTHGESSSWQEKRSKPKGKGVHLAKAALGGETDGAKAEQKQRKKEKNGNYKRIISKTGTRICGGSR